MTRRPARLVLPLLVSLALFALYWFLRATPLELGRFGDVREAIFGADLRGLFFAAWIPVIFFIVRLIDALAFDVFATRRQHVTAPILLREILSIVLYFLLFAWAVSGIFHYSVTAFLATGTVLAAVLGLALQDTLGNLFSGIALHLEETFRVGDVIRTGDFIGVVEAVRWRGTRIRTFNNNMVVLPNSLLSRERLEIFPRENLNARVLQISIDYHYAPARVIEVLAQAAVNVEGVSHDMPCIARVGGFGDSAVTYEVKYFMRDYAMRDRIDAEVRRAIWYALRRNGMTIPYPIRSVQRYQAPPESGGIVAREELIARLRAVDLLSPLGNEAHEQLAGAARVHLFARGETILRHGAAGDSMFVLHDGHVSVRVADREVARLGAGAVFGEMALLTGERRTADVVAVADVIAIEIAKDALRPVLQNHPELATAISAKVEERRDDLETLRSDGYDEEHKSVLSRIRAYFGL
ncbi:MAG TPA: mechanosensitive ion channel family protein [Thermoanaerobaculia bacterium]|nr:mechanosensitive ion channel family protein [Thermoanaerobaculia bacterium]